MIKFIVVLPDTSENEVGDGEVERDDDMSAVQGTPWKEEE